MITREKLEEILNNYSNYPFREKGVDHNMKALTLLRDKIPYEVCKEIIVSVEHDLIYLCYVDEVLPYINEDDAKVLSDANFFIVSDCDRLSMFA